MQIEKKTTLTQYLVCVGEKVVGIFPEDQRDLAASEVDYQREHGWYAGTPRLEVRITTTETTQYEIAP